MQCAGKLRVQIWRGGRERQYELDPHRKPELQYISLIINAVYQTQDVFICNIFVSRQIFK